MKNSIPSTPGLFRNWVTAASILGILLIGASLGSSAQTLDPSFNIPEIYTDANVTDAVQLPNGQYVVGGNFTRVNGQAIKGLAQLDANGVADQAFWQNMSGATVHAEKVYPMANGQLLVQGHYSAGTVQRRHLFRLNADGTLDPSFNLALPGAGMLPEVKQVIVQPDGRLLVLGLYLTGYSVSFDLLRVMSDGTRDTSFSVALTNFSQDQLMALQTDGKIVLGGSLSAVNGIRQFFFARLNGNGSFDTSYYPAAYTNARLYINSMALDANNSLLVGGLGINNVNGQATPLFRMLSTGAFDPSFTCPTSLIGRDCQQVSLRANGHISVLMSTYSSVTNSHYSFNGQLYRLQATGALDTSFQPGTGPDNNLSGIRSLPNGNVLAWGGLSNYAGQRRALALLQPTGGLNANFAPLLQKAGSVHKIIRQANGALVITGRFNSINGHFTDLVARLLPSGQPDVSFSWRQPTSASWNTTALTVQADGRILLAGRGPLISSQVVINPPSRRVFTRLTTTGTTDGSFSPALPFNSAASPDTTYISMLAEQANGQILVGGAFVDAAGKANLTRLTTTGLLEPTFTPRANQPRIHKGFVQANGSIVTTSFEGEFERLLANGQPDPSFAFALPVQAPAPGFPYAWADNIFPLSYTTTYAISGLLTPTEVLGKLSVNGANTTGFASPFNRGTYVSSVAEQGDGRLVVGGVLLQGSLPNTPRVLLARLNTNGQLDTSFDTNFISGTGNYSYLQSNPYPLLPVADVLVQPDGALVIGGYFSQAGNQSVTGLVRLRAAGVLAVHSGASTQTEVWPVPAQSVLNLKLDASARPQRVSLLDALGRVVLMQPVVHSEFTITTAQLARGLYVLRVDYASGPATRRVVLE